MHLSFVPAMNWKYNHPLRNLFTYATILLLIAGCCALLCWNKEQGFLFLNNRHTDVADLLLKYLTHVGDGLFMVVTGVIIFLVGKRKLGVLLVLSFLLSGLLVQVVKRVEERPRPGLYFKKPQLIHRVDDYLLKGKNSFPSGHTTTAFAMFSLFAFAVRNKGLQLLFFAAAVIIGYSRIYLGQHFTEDVLAGAALGFLTSFFLAWLFRKKEWE